MSLVNWALAANGSTATGTNTAVGDPMRVINGFRHTNNLWHSGGAVADGGGWGSLGITPSGITIDLGQPRAISRIEVFTLADAVQYAENPSLTDEFVTWGTTHADIEYWDGSAWVLLDQIASNNNVRVQLNFPEVTFQLFRVLGTASTDGAIRFVEIEAWGDVPVSFERPRSAFIDSYFAEKAALDSRAFNSHLAFDITLRNGTSMRFATKEILMDTVSKGSISQAITPIQFLARVDEAPADIRHSQTKTVDGGAINLINLDYTLSQLIAHTDRLYEGASVVVYLCFPKTTGNYEGMIYANLVITSPIGDDEKVTLQTVSDVSARDSMLGMEMTQRCQNTLGDAWCGVGHLPPGAECSLVHADREGGCLYWGGVFKGAPHLNPTGYVAGFNGTIDPGSGGFDDTTPGGYQCPDYRSWFRTPNGYVRGGQLKAGDLICWHDEIVTVLRTRRVYAPFRYLIESSVGASLVCSASHLMLRSFDDDDGFPLHQWKQDRDHLIARTPAGRFKLHGEEYRIKPTFPGDVLQLETSAPHKYECGRNREFMFECHNKPIFPFLLS
jgi:hypothetical protein